MHLFATTAIASEEHHEGSEQAGPLRFLSEGNMELGMIGLGQMGTNMVQRLMRTGHQCVVYAGRVSDSGEGRWTIAAAIDEPVPAPVLSAALYERFYSRGKDEVADQLLSTLHYQFGGHQEKPAAAKAGT